jgi:hypothetical protein
MGDPMKPGESRTGRLMIVSNGGIFEPDGSRLCEWIILIDVIDYFPREGGTIRGRLCCHANDACGKRFEFVPDQ